MTEIQLVHQEECFEEAEEHGEANKQIGKVEDKIRSAWKRTMSYQDTVL